jgi:hypothetical protein
MPVDLLKVKEINPLIFNVMDSIKDIAQVCAEGSKVYDDNKALPENRPRLDAPPIRVLFDGPLQEQVWGWDRLDQQEDPKTHHSRMNGHKSTKPTSTYLSSFSLSHDSSRILSLG